MAFENCQPDDAIMAAIKASLDNRLAEIVESEVAAAKKRIDARAPELIAGIALKLYSQISFENWTRVIAPSYGQGPWATSDMWRRI